MPKAPLISLLTLSCLLLSAASAAEVEPAPKTYVSDRADIIDSATEQRLTGLLIGHTLHTRPEEIYRALIEATAFGALTIINRFEEYGCKVEEVINCGGIAEKNPLLMQIYADITGREMKISRSEQTCALGSAIAAAVVATSRAGGYDNFADAQAQMTGLKDITYKPIPENQKVYQQLYELYMQLHDAFGVVQGSASMANIMKDLLDIKEKTNTI